MRRRASLRLGRQTLPPGQAAPSNMSRLSTASDKDYFANTLLTAERVYLSQRLNCQPIMRLFNCFKVNCTSGHGNVPFLVLVLHASQYCTALGGNEFYWNRLGLGREPRTICVENECFSSATAHSLASINGREKQAGTRLD
jgi:hypothetical protein